MLYARTGGDGGDSDGRGGRALERRHSLRLTARLGHALQRAGSLRSLPPRPPPSSLAAMDVGLHPAQAPPESKRNATCVSAPAERRTP